MLPLQTLCPFSAKREGFLFHSLISASFKQHVDLFFCDVGFAFIELLQIMINGPVVIY